MEKIYENDRCRVYLDEEKCVFCEIKNTDVPILCEFAHDERERCSDCPLVSCL